MAVAAAVVVVVAAIVVLFLVLMNGDLEPLEPVLYALVSLCDGLVRQDLMCLLLCVLLLLLPCVLLLLLLQSWWVRLALAAT